MGNTCKFINKEEQEIISSPSKDDMKNEFQEIKDFRNEISKMNIFKRKSIAKDEYNNYIQKIKNKKIIINDEKNEIKEQYISIIYLLLIDNTNKDIVKLYLNFLKNNSIFIKENNLLSFKDEVNKYSIIFKIDEIEQIEKNIKQKSQKDIFLDFLEYIKNIDFGNKTNINNFYENIKKILNKLYLFNTPIEFDNMELYYYKCYYDLLNEINLFTNNEEYKAYFIKTRQNVIKYILDNNLYNNEQIISNENKMNLLLLYLLKEEFNIYYNENVSINFNRLIQPIPVTINDFKKIKEINKMDELIKRNNNYYIFHNFNSKEYDSIKKEKDENSSSEKEEAKDEQDKDEDSEEEEDEDSEEEFQVNKNVEKEKEEEEEEGLLIPLNKVCIDNLINCHLNVDNCINFYYNLDKLMTKNEISPFVNKIKKFLEKIINSKVYKQAIQKLFPHYYQYLLYNNCEDIKQYISERIKFYPFQDLYLSGFTDKLSCYSYITSINFEIINNRRNTININTYKIGLTIINSLFEINNANQSILNFKCNNKNFIDKSNKRKEDNESLVKLLFGKNLTHVNLFQSLYIMNEKNYNQDLFKFRENFENIKNIIKLKKEKTNFIKINKGNFKDFYEESKLEVKNLIMHINEDEYFIPEIIIRNSNKHMDIDNLIPTKKCGLIGRKIPD